MALFLTPPSPYVYKRSVGEWSLYNVRSKSVAGSDRHEKRMTLAMRVLAVERDGTARMSFDVRDLEPPNPKPEPPEILRITRYGRIPKGERVWPGNDFIVFAFALPQTKITSAWTLSPDPLGLVVGRAPIESRIVSATGGRVVIAARSRSANPSERITRETTFDVARGCLLSVKIRAGIAPGPQIELDLMREPSPPRR